MAIFFFAGAFFWLVLTAACSNWVLDRFPKLEPYLPWPDSETRIPRSIRLKSNEGLKLIRVIRDTAATANPETLTIKTKAWKRELREELESHYGDRVGAALEETEKAPTTEIPGVLDERQIKALGTNGETALAIQTVRNRLRQITETLCGS
jgi:hypothetical protein